MPTADPNLKRFVDRTGDLINSAQVPLTSLVSVFLWEVEGMLSAAVRGANPAELAELRQLVGTFSISCADLVEPAKTCRRDYH